MTFLGGASDLFRAEQSPPFGWSIQVTWKKLASTRLFYDCEWEPNNIYHKHQPNVSILYTYTIFWVFIILGAFGGNTLFWRLNLVLNIEICVSVWCLIQYVPPLKIESIRTVLLGKPHVCKDRWYHPMFFVFCFSFESRTISTIFNAWKYRTQRWENCRSNMDVLFAPLLFFWQGFEN